MDKRHAVRHLLRAAILMDEVNEDFYFTGLSTRALMRFFLTLAPVGRRSDTTVTKLPTHARTPGIDCGVGHRIRGGQRCGGGGHTDVAPM